LAGLLHFRHVLPLFGNDPRLILLPSYSMAIDLRFRETWLKNTNFQETRNLAYLLPNAARLSRT
jgi:hypothetical protein